ncbi:5'/3'-nucleotidase SurE [Neorickettsia helminthoeca]|nr:5'/3'-nucleotidase SurE [Neorickettsia helminthoeca]
MTNDDGVTSEGLRLLRELILSMGFRDIVVVAPKTDKTASGHALSIHKRLKIEEIENNTFAVDGTPVDCVITAFYDPRCTGNGTPEVVFSGVNIGANLGIDTMYSGTVAAAMQGMFFGVPSFALSQFYESGVGIRWNVHSSHLKDYILGVLENRQTFKNCVLNINLPSKRIIGIKHVKQYNTEEKKATDASAIAISTHSIDNEEYITIETTGSPQSCQFLSSGYVTVTPIGSDLTDYSVLKALDEDPSRRQNGD